MPEDLRHSAASRPSSSSRYTEKISLGGGVPGEPGRVRDACRTHPDHGSRVTQQPEEPLGVVGRVVALDQEPGHAIAHDVAQTADCCGDDRAPARLGLQGDQPERLRARGDEHDVGGGVEVGEADLRLGREEHDALAHAQRRRERSIR